jgi:hypothetical protein
VNLPLRCAGRLEGKTKKGLVAQLQELHFFIDVNTASVASNSCVGIQKGKDGNGGSVHRVNPIDKPDETNDNNYSDQ